MLWPVCVDLHCFVIPWQLLNNGLSLKKTKKSVGEKNDRNFIWSLVAQ